MPTYRFLLALALILMGGLIGRQEASAQYSPFGPDPWESVMGCEDTYLSGLSDCNSNYSNCYILYLLGQKTQQECQSQYDVCRFSNGEGWSTCIGGIHFSDPVSTFCDEARAKRDACYQYMDYCSTLALAPEDQAICDEGAYYCTVSSGVSQCE